MCDDAPPGNGSPELLRPLRTLHKMPRRTTRWLRSIGIARYGTGSYPPSWNGWQRNIRRSARYPPLMAPYFSTASSAYCEHVGVNRQQGVCMGDMHAR